jgi:hypothetical protein
MMIRPVRRARHALHEVDAVRESAESIGFGEHVAASGPPWQ